MKNLSVLGDSPEIEYAEEMRLDEGGFDLLVDDNIVISGSFENLDPFELAYRVLPEDPEIPASEVGAYKLVQKIFKEYPTEQLETEIWLGLQELAQRGGYLK